MSDCKSATTIANPPQRTEDVYHRNEQLIFDMRREIDPQSSPRGRAFELWKNAPMPKVTITKTFNIGRLVKAGRRRGLKTNMLICWCIGHAANPITEFYTLPAGGRLWQYDCLAVNTVVMTAKGEPHLCDIPFSEDIHQFNERKSRRAKLSGRVAS